MRLLSLSVEHFRCIRKAGLNFAPGLNVLFGPNDLGKSSLAHAIRAVLLLQHNAKEHETFFNWSGSGEPYVELVFETEPQRIYRVKKRFGPSGSSFLDESRNGIDFTNECRGRDVDGRLREILCWGIAPPGKGAPKGMPTSFLSTALFAEQDQVDAIFEHALPDDSDETGKKRLSEVLQAMAEDPIFRGVLAKAQGCVDEAFGKNGVKKTGKNSPWTRHREAIRQADEYYRQCQDELKETERLEAELRELLEQKLQRQERLDSAAGQLQKVEEDFERQEQRQKIVARLDECKTRLREITAELNALADAEKRQLELAQRVATLQNAEGTWKADFQKAAARVKEAEGTLVRLQSEDRARERVLKQNTLERRQADLRAEQERNQGVLGKISAIEAAVTKVQSIEKEAQTLSQLMTDLLIKYDGAAKAVRESEEQQRELGAIARLFHLKTAKADLEQAEQSLAQICQWGESAQQKRTEAAELESAIPTFDLPDAAKLSELRRLEGDIRVAAGKLDVGLAVTIRPKRDIRLTIQRDGAKSEDHELRNRELQTTARRQISVDIQDVAEVTVTGGADDARQELELLERQWQKEAAPLLEAAGAASLDELVQAAEETVRKRRTIEDARKEAAQLEQRITDQPNWAELLRERQERYAAAEKELGEADRAKPEKVAAKLGFRDLAAIEKRLAALRTNHNNLISAQTELATQLAGERGRQAEKQKSLESARNELAETQSQIEGNWPEKKQQALERQAALARELRTMQAELASLSAAEDKSLEDAQQALQKCKSEFSDADEALRKTTEELTKARENRAIGEGALHKMREAVAKLDENAARNGVAEVDDELRSYAAPDPPIREQRVIEARNTLEAARAELTNIENQIHAKRGALQQVGGDVSKQRAAEAAAQLAIAKQRERETELDFKAWDLLRQTLREAEQEESSHLGRLLADPIASRFSELTGGRYNKLALGPALETQGVFVAGGDRDVSMLSVGTKDQLSTVLRLTIAEQLKSTIVLDDQLTQSDVPRMEWLRDFLLRLSESIQIIVFTCRPENYLPNGVGHPAVHSLELAQIIERSMSAFASGDRHSQELGHLSSA